MNLIEGSFFHPATPFVVLGLILPFLRGNFWRVLLFIPPLAAIFLTLGAHPGLHWQVDYVGQTLVLGRVDGLSLPFIILFSFMTLICTLFSFHVRERAQHVAALFFMAGAFGCVLSGDYWTLYMFWQGMTVSSSFLIWLNRSKDASKTGFLYMMLLLLSSVLLLAGILLREQATGTFVFGPADSNLMYHYDYLILAAFAINAAIVPVHAWMTRGLPKATVTGAVFLSIFGLKTALYAMMRCFAGLDLLIGVGVLMTLYGGVYALFSKDIRRILAYLMVAQTGLMITGVGIDTQAALDGAIFLAYAHTFYNALLLMAMGAVIFTTGEDQLSRLGNLAGKLPFVVVSTLLGMLALCAVPFFSGFPGSTIILEEVLGLKRPIPGAILVFFPGVGMVLTVMAGGLRLPFFMFGSKNTGTPEIRKSLPANMVGAMAITGAFCLIQGVFPEALNRLLSYPVEARALTLSRVGVGFMFPVAGTLLFVFLRPLLKPHLKSGFRELPDFERIYVFMGRGVLLFLSGPLSWLDGIWSQVYRTVFLRAYNFLARFSDVFDRKGIDGAVNRTAWSVMGLSRMSTRLQSRSLQDQLAWMLLLVLAVFGLIWIW